VALSVAACAEPGPSAMAWSNEEADYFVICLFKCRQEASAASAQFVGDFAQSVRGCGGNIHLRSDKAKDWDILDGRDHHAQPNHLSPAIFDFNCVVLAGFHRLEDVHLWWSSDSVFSILKLRQPIEKMGIFIVEGLQRSVDLLERNRFHFGDRILFFEFVSNLAFRPIQQYVDDYKRFSENASRDAGVDCRLLFAESTSSVLMNEFPLDAVCASSWRMKSDAHAWYDTDLYQEHLMPLRSEHARCLSVLIPMFPEDRVDDFERAKKTLAVSSKLNTSIIKKR